MRTLASLDSPISSLVVSPDGSTVITASDEGIGFLDLMSGQRSVTPLEEEVSRLTWGPDGLLAGTLSGEVWAVGDAPARLFEAIDEEISGIAVARDGTIAVCGGEPFAVATFGPHGNEEWRGEPYRWPYCVRFSSDGKLLAVATWDGYLFVFDVQDLPDELRDVDGEQAGGPIFDLRFLPGDRVLVVGASFVRIWDRGVARYTGNRELDAEAFAVAVSPDGSCAVVSTNDQRLRLFALPDLTELGELCSGSKGTKALSYFPDYAEFCHVKGPATIRTLAFHPDGTRVFGSTEDRRIVEVTRAELQRTAERATTPPKATLPAITAPAKAPPASTASTDIAATSSRVNGKAAASDAAGRNAATGKAVVRTRTAGTTAARTRTAGTTAARTRTAGTTAARTRTASTTAARTRTASTTAARTPTAGKARAGKPAASRRLPSTRVSKAASKPVPSTPVVSKAASKPIPSNAGKKRAGQSGAQRISASRRVAATTSGGKTPAFALLAGRKAAAKRTGGKIIAEVATLDVTPGRRRSRSRPRPRRARATPSSSGT